MRSKALTLGPFAPAPTSRHFGVCLSFVSLHECTPPPPPAPRPAPSFLSPLVHTVGQGCARQKAWEQDTGHVLLLCMGRRGVLLEAI